jgi:hypothetical protein
MLGLILHITSSSSTAAASMFCIPPLCDPNWSMLLLPGTALHRWSRPNLKGLKENLLPYAIADFFVGLCCKNY